MRLLAQDRLSAADYDEERQSFLPQRLVMIDCEMTGLDPHKDDVIQIAALKLELIGAQYVPVEEEFNIFLHTDLQPTSAFAKQHMKSVYEKANDSQTSYEDARAMLAEWMGPWAGKVSPCGDCVPTDILFLFEKNVISLSRYDGDTPVDGLFHYEYFDMNAIKLVARHKMGYKFDKDLPVIPGAHDALVDCQNQLVEMNAIISVLLK